MNDILQQGILRLLYSAVTGEIQTLPEGFDLAQAMPIIKAHQIGNLVYYGAANCGIDTKLPVMQELFAVTYKSMLIDERQRAELKRLTDAFDANGVHYMPVKGILMKELYPKSDMRIMGDADILIKVEQYDRIVPIVEALGYHFVVETDHELVWENPGLHLELHKRLIPDYNRDFVDYYGDCWRLGKAVADHSGWHAMSDEDHMIYLFTHFAKHYRTGGIGVRHMLDLYIYRNAKAHMDNQYLFNELKKLGLYDFYANIFKTLAVWFEGAEHSCKTQIIADHIFGSGAYGSSSQRMMANAIWDQGKTGKNARQIQRKKWIQIIFLPYSSMCIKYPVLKKAKVLLPIMWVARWVEILIKKPGRISRIRKNVGIINESALDSFEERMNVVGLSFDFKEREE